MFRVRLGDVNKDVVEGGKEIPVPGGGKKKRLDSRINGQRQVKTANMYKEPSESKHASSKEVGDVKIRRRR